MNPFVFQPDQAHMVTDVESVGLHGEGFAFAYAIFEGGEEVESDWFGCPHPKADGAASDRQWITSNVPTEVLYPTGDHCLEDPHAVRRHFWSNVWVPFRERGLIWADVGWPVEANLFSACMRDMSPALAKAGPFPLHEIATVRAALTMIDPASALEIHRTPRNAMELPAHHPLPDARFSGRQLIKILNALYAARRP